MIVTCTIVCCYLCLKGKWNNKTVNCIVINNNYCIIVLVGLVVSCWLGCDHILQTNSLYCLLNINQMAGHSLVNQLLLSRSLYNVETEWS